MSHLTIFLVWWGGITSPFIHFCKSSTYIGKDVEAQGGHAGIFTKCNAFELPLSFTL